MQRVAQFYKVSYQQFYKDWKDTFTDSTSVEIQNIYDRLRLPERATSGSAGYDFFAPISMTLHPGETIKIPTGIRAEIAEGWVLSLYPRSSLGFKYRLQLNNTVGIIDSDYFYSDNEGHIFAKITNASTKKKTLYMKEGDGFLQGIFLPFGITCDDEVVTKRNGGFGSTNQND